MEREEEEEENYGQKDDDNSKEEEEAEEEMMKNTENNRKATSETLATIANDCNNFLAFLQAVAVKSAWVIAAPLSLRAEKH